MTLTVVAFTVLVFTVLGRLAIRTTLVWLLWGWVMPGTFGLPSLGFGQAFGLVLLVIVLCGFPVWRDDGD